MNKKIVISGVLGFIGMKVAKEYSDLGYHVIGIDTVDILANLPTPVHCNVYLDQLMFGDDELAERIAQTTNSELIHCRL